MADKETLNHLQGFAQKLEKITSDLADVKSDLADVKTAVVTLSERVNNHISFFQVALGILVTACLTLAGFAYNQHGVISSIQGRLGQTVESAYASDIKLDAFTPLEPDSSTSAVKTLQLARQEKIRIDAEVVKAAGKRFLSASEGQNNAAWKAAIAFIDYRSFLNTDNQPDLGPPKAVENPEYHFVITVKSAAGAQAPYTHFVGQVLPYGTATAEGSARYEPIDSSQGPSGFAYVLVRQTGPNNLLVLDDKRIKNVVIADSAIEYDGGPLLLENVYFVNCSFVLQPTTKSLALGKGILESASVKFDSADVRESRGENPGPEIQSLRKSDAGV